MSRFIYASEEFNDLSELSISLNKALNVYLRYFDNPIPKENFEQAQKFLLETLFPTSDNGIDSSLPYERKVERIIRDYIDKVQIREVFDGIRTTIQNGESLSGGQKDILFSLIDQVCTETAKSFQRMRRLR